MECLTEQELTEEELKLVKAWRLFKHYCKNPKTEGEYLLIFDDCSGRIEDWNDLQKFKFHNLIELINYLKTQINQ